MTKAIAPENCDICRGKLRSGPTYYDGRVYVSLHQTPWAWCCQECWNERGVGLGTGRGQEYDSKTNEKLRG